jgi:hypothetical protein
LQIAARINLIKNISPTPLNARDDQPRTSFPQLSLRRSVNPPGRGPLHHRAICSHPDIGDTVAFLRIEFPCLLAAFAHLFGELSAMGCFVDPTHRCSRASSLLISVAILPSSRMMVIRSMSLRVLGHLTSYACRGSK